MSIEDFEAILNQQFNKEFIIWDGSQYGAIGSDIVEVKRIDRFCAELALIEEKLNETKSKIDRIMRRRDGKEKWRSHTKFTHTLKDLPKRILEALQNRGETTSRPIWEALYTQAYCKFMELIVAYPQLIPDSADDFRTLHLCEAPGAFVCAIRDNILGKQELGEKYNWRYWINSLRTDENDGLLLDGNIEKHVENITLGPSPDGDIFKWDDRFIDDFVQQCGGKFLLVTADGSFDCTDNPIDQEISVRPLIAQEIRVAFRCLGAGGNFVLKIFTFFQLDTVKELLLPLIINFERVICRKPSSSKPGNSEMYLICLNRKNDSSPTTNEECKNRLFEQIVTCAEFFASQQIDYIEFNLQTYSTLSQSQKAAINIRKCAVNEFMTTEILKKIFPNG